MAIALPPPQEQRAIVEALSDTESVIASMEHLLAKKRNVKLATAQVLLSGAQRLPGFTRAWDTYRLGGIGSTYGGLSGKRAADFGRGQSRYVPFLNVIGNVRIDAAFVEPVSVTTGEHQSRVRAGDLLFNGTSETPDELAMGAMILEDVPDLYLNSFCFGFRIHDLQSFDPLFIAFTFRSAVGRRLLYRLAQGATRYNLSKSHFLKLELAFPRFDEQCAIAEVLSDLDDEIAALEVKRDKLKLIKQGMMQQLLTGQIRFVELVGAA